MHRTRKYPLEDSESEYLGLIDDNLYLNAIRSEIKNTLGSKYLWLGFFDSLARKGRSFEIQPNFY